MTPEERQLVDDLFDRLAKLEATPRDPDAERAIADGLRRAPNAVYALVQTALVQDEALRRADARIRELSEGAPAQEQQQGGSFLDTMRSAFGSGGRTSVPTVRPGAQGGAGGPDPRWNRGGAMPETPGSGGGYVAAPGYGPAPGYGGGSFLGTAAASAAGMIGGSLLLNSIGSMFGHHGGSAFASTPQSSPWDSSAAGSDLAREAGAGDVGGNRQSALDDQGGGLFGDSNVDPTALDDDPAGSDFGDLGGGDDSA
jgi:uncharacterized protein